MTQQLFLMSDVSRMLGVPADNILDGGPAGQIEAIPESIRMERAGEPSLIGAFSVHRSGHVGQEILNQDGKIIAWTTDEWTAQVICKLLNEHQELI